MKGIIVCLHGFGEDQRVWDDLSKLGVSADRVMFTADCSRSEYLALYHRVDIVLDTLPYNGHTTSLDAMWMGVPVVVEAPDDDAVVEVELLLGLEHRVVG